MEEARRRGIENAYLKEQVVQIAQAHARIQHAHDRHTEIHESQMAAWGRFLIWLSTAIQQQARKNGMRCIKMCSGRRTERSKSKMPLTKWYNVLLIMLSIAGMIVILALCTGAYQ